MASLETLRHYLVKQAGHGCTEAGALLPLVRAWEEREEREESEEREAREPAAWQTQQDGKGGNGKGQTPPPHPPIGFTACYIHDHREFRRLRDLSVHEAVACASLCCPEVVMGNHTQAKDLTIGTGDDTDALGNGWLNKLFIVIGTPNGNPVAIYNHDGQFSVYQALAAEGGAA
jgi:hypothetical protein